MAVRYDVVATIGTYQKNNQTNYINRKVGNIIDTQNGPSLVLEAHFNPAGCLKGDDGKVWLKLFPPKPKPNQPPSNQPPPPPANQPQGAYQQQPSTPPQANEFDDDIPF